MSEKQGRKKVGFAMDVAYAKLVWDAPWSREQWFLVRMRGIMREPDVGFVFHMACQGHTWLERE